MRKSPLRGLTGTFLVATLVLLILQACQEPADQGNNVGAASTSQFLLTVTGTGTGSGVVTSSPTGINCTITNGLGTGPACSINLAKNTVVTLTAVPVTGQAFSFWGSACTGSSGCAVTMTAARSATARFSKGPFKVTVVGSDSGGNGTVRSQSGLTPVINCVITAGVAGGAGCSASYPANTALVLTATPKGGTFDGWGAPCDQSGSGPCQSSTVLARTITARFSTATSEPPGTQATRGEWAPMFATPYVAVHMTLLPTGKVLMWGAKGQGELWDPATGEFTEITDPYKIFCAGHTFLPDGRLLVAGGHISNMHGLPLAAIFDPATNSWSSTGTMAHGRWYPTNTMLPNGDVLTIAGKDEDAIMTLTPEIWSGGTWRQLTGAGNLDLPFYPRMFLAPNGNVFMAGERQTSYYLSVGGNGAWIKVGGRRAGSRSYGSAVEYAPGKILYAGGGDPPMSSAEVIDLNQAKPTWRAVGSMAYARRHMNATLLPDGKVLVTNGTSGPGFSNEAATVRVAEMWNPATETFSTMASEADGRAYHSTSLLLPDARVLSSGSGDRDSLTPDHRTAQIFSPPYLFLPDGSPAPRPTITSAPTAVSYGQTFTVQTPDAATVTRGTLIRAGSVTHSFNQSQIIWSLTFSQQDATTLRATAPANAIKAPSGPYLLFLMSASGVPSVASFVTIGP